MKHFSNLLVTEQFLSISVDGITKMVPMTSSTCLYLKFPKFKSPLDTKIIVDGIEILPKFQNQICYKDNFWSIGDKDLPFYQWLHKITNSCRLFTS